MAHSWRVPGLAWADEATRAVLGQPGKRASPRTAEGRARSKRCPLELGRIMLGEQYHTVQMRILQALRVPRAHVAITGCFGFGKTRALAAPIVWWPTAFDEGQCYTTGPTASVVKVNTWKEVHAVLGQSDWNKGRGPPPYQLNKTEFYPYPEASQYRFSMGLSTDDEQRFHGKHGKAFFVVEEAGGCEAWLFDAIDNNRSAGEVSAAYVGNPMSGPGPYRDFFLDDPEAHGLTAVFQVSAFDTPNLIDIPGETPEDKLAELLSWSAGDPRIDAGSPTWGSRLITRRYAWEKAKSWGVESPLFQAKVMGRFPSEDANALIPIDALDRACREPEIDDRAPFILGVDPAGDGGDEVASVAMHGYAILSEWGSRTPKRAYPAWQQWAEPWRDVTTSVQYDKAAIGHGWGQLLQRDGWPAKGLHPQDVMKSAEDKERFRYARDRRYWMLGQAFRDGRVSGLKKNGKLYQQLASLRWKLYRSRITMETKEERKARGLGSPDRAEACMHGIPDTGPSSIGALLNRGRRSGSSSGHRRRRGSPLAGIQRKVF